VTHSALQTSTFCWILPVEPNKRSPEPTPRPHADRAFHRDPLKCNRIFFLVRGEVISGWAACQVPYMGPKKMEEKKAHLPRIRPDKYTYLSPSLLAPCLFVLRNTLPWSLRPYTIGKRSCEYDFTPGLTCQTSVPSNVH